LLPLYCYATTGAYRQEIRLSPSLGKGNNYESVIRALCEQATISDVW